MSSQDQDSTRTTRRSLKALQRVASDEENFVGRPSKSLKHQLSQESSIESEVKRKTFSSKETKASIEKKVTIDDLTNPEGASETYWQILAEKRLAALQETLAENEKLHKIIKELKEENTLYKQMLDEASSFIEVFKEEITNGSNDDTGIDVNDVSTANSSITDTSTLEAAEDIKTTSDK